MEDKKKDIKINSEDKGSTRYDSQYDEPQSWAEEAKEDLATWLDEKGIYIRP